MRRKLIVLASIIIIVALGSIVLFASSSNSLPLTSSSRIVISFDDVGYGNSVWETAYPVMEQYGFKGVAYCIVSKVNRADAISSLKLLAVKGWEIGSHTMTHADLATLSADKLLSEVLDSKIWLEDHIQTSVSSFAYPYSSYNPTVISLVAQYYKVARTNAWWAWQSTVWNNNSTYEIPSIAIANGNYAYNIPTAINMASASGKTVVLLFHRVMLAGDGPSITPERFAWCMKQISNSGIPVATIEELTN